MSCWEKKGKNMRATPAKTGSSWLQLAWLLQVFLSPSKSSMLLIGFTWGKLFWHLIEVYILARSSTVLGAGADKSGLTFYVFCFLFACSTVDSMFQCVSCRKINNFNAHAGLECTTSNEINEKYKKICGWWDAMRIYGFDSAVSDVDWFTSSSTGSSMLSPPSATPSMSSSSTSSSMSLRANLMALASL